MATVAFDNVFEPSDIRAMSTAIDDVCRTLNLADAAGSKKELLAKKIIGFAHEGPRDAALLRDRTLSEIFAGRGEWAMALAAPFDLPLGNLVHSAQARSVGVTSTVRARILAAAFVLAGALFYIVALLGTMVFLSDRQCGSEFNYYGCDISTRALSLR
jgi:hypothetical protein